MQFQIYGAAVLPNDYVQDDTLPFDELNQIKNEREGDLLPISDSTYEYTDSTYDLGSATYQWEDLHLDNDLIVNTSVFFVDGSAGNVGIGTASPLSDLHIVNNAITGAAAPTTLYDSFVVDNDVVNYINLRSSSAGTTQWGGIMFSDDTRFAGAIKYEHRSSDAEKDFMSFHTDATQRMTIDNSGNVGIGVADPDTPLEILNASTQLKLSYNGTVNATLGVDSTGDIIIIPSGGDTILGGNTNPAIVRIKSTSEATGVNGAIYFYSEDDASNETLFGGVVIDVNDVSNGSEDSTLELRTRDSGSGVTNVKLLNSAFYIKDGITAPGAVTGYAGIYVDTSDGDLKVVFADGTVKTIVTDS